MNILSIDQNILIWLNSFFIGRGPALDQLFKFLAVYLIYALPVILLLMWFLIKTDKKRRAMMMSMGSVILSIFVFNQVIASFWFRPRPDFVSIGLKEVFFHRPTYSFPSDHAANLFSIAFTMHLLGYKKAGNWFLLYAVVITFARVVIAVHYPLDIIGGVAVALIASLIIWLFRKTLDKYIYKPFTSFLKRIYLA